MRVSNRSIVESMKERPEHRVVVIKQYDLNGWFFFSFLVTFLISDS